MSEMKSKAQGLRAYLIFSAITALFYIAFANLSYQTVFMKAQGFTSMQIGTITACGSAMGIFAPTFWGLLSDKLKSRRLIFCITFIGSAIFLALLPTLAGFGALGFAMGYACGAFFRSANTPLLDAWIVQETAHYPGMQYGKIRLWGSLSYGLMCLALTPITKAMGVAVPYYLYALFGIPLLALCLGKKDVGEHQKKERLTFREMKVGRLFRSPSFVGYLFFTIALSLPLQAAFTFFPYLLEEVAGETTALGIIVGVQALLEVPLMFFSGHLMKKRPAVLFLVLVGVFYAVEYLAFSMVTTVTQVLLVRCLHGMGYGLYVSCNVQYVRQITPKELLSTAQALVGTMSSVAGILGNLLGGWLLGNIGVRVYYIAASSIEAVAVVVFVLLLAWIKKRKPSDLQQSA